MYVSAGVSATSGGIPVKIHIWHAILVRYAEYRCDVDRPVIQTHYIKRDRPSLSPPPTLKVMKVCITYQ